MSKDSEHLIQPAKKFELGRLGNLNQVAKALGKTIRATADGSIDSQVGARICNGLGHYGACLGTVTLECLEERLDELQYRLTDSRTSGRTEPHGCCQRRQSP
jgi:hypothetical protein